MNLTEFNANQYYHLVYTPYWINTMTQEKDRGPGVKIPPPLIFLIAIGLGYLINRFYPLANLNSYFWMLIASTGIILCIGVLGYALFSFLKAKTHIEPWQPAKHLITNGLYRYSRNPIYVTFFVLTICVGLLLSNVWIVLLAIPALGFITLYVIKKEEAYLEATFGEKYNQYKRQVRRWL